MPDVVEGCWWLLIGLSGWAAVAYGVAGWRTREGAFGRLSGVALLSAALLWATLRTPAIAVTVPLLLLVWQAGILFLLGLGPTLQETYRSTWDIFALRPARPRR